MNPAGKLILGILVGAITFIIVVSVFQLAGHALIPSPEGVETATPEQLAAYINERPIALLPVLIAYVFGSFAGPFVAVTVAGTGPITAAVTIGILGMIANVMNVKTISHPTWFVGVSFMVLLPMAWLGGRIVAARRP